MPQEIRVLQCSECKMYQVDIVKLAKKWQCKMCGVKQTPQTEYFRGTGAECRTKAQDLNMARGKQRQQEADQVLELLASDDDSELAQLELPQEAESKPQPSTPHSSSKSKWSAYMDAAEPATEEAASENNAAQFQMLNFGSTQRWSQSINADLKRANASERPTEVPKKKCSKWDAYV